MFADPDPVSALVGLLRPSAMLSKPIKGRGSWGVCCLPRQLPSFYLVAAGRCWLQIENCLPERIECGDFLILMVTPGLVLASDLSAPCRPGTASATAVRHGEPEGPADFEMLAGTFQVEQPNALLLLKFLPERFHLRAAWLRTSRLAQIIELINQESAAERPARELLQSRLVDILLLEVLRCPTAASPVPPTGLLAGLHDHKIARALRAMHSDLSQGWTITSLARHVGLSRAALADRFLTTLGVPPMEYLTRWRMSFAVDALIHRDVSLDRLARDTGYDSARAFSTAFSRHMGCAPRAFAKSRSAARSATAGDS